MVTYGLKYLCEYRSKMRGRLLYRIEIEERGALRPPDRLVKRMRPYSDVFTIKWGNADDAEYTAVKGSTLTLKVLCTKNMEYLGLFTVDPRKYRVTIYEYRDAPDGHAVKAMLWRGFLSATSYKEDFARPPYVVTLTATDGFSVLSTMPYRDENGAKYSGVKSLYTLCQELMDVLGLDLPCVEWTNLIEKTGPESRPSFFGIHIDTDRIYRTYENPTWRDILEICTQPFNAQIFQARGVIHIRRILSLLPPERPAGFDPYAVDLQLTRSTFRRLWQNGCDVNASSELNLLPPYRLAAISVSNTDSTITDCYNKDRWSMGRQMIVLHNRIVAEVVRGVNYKFKVGEFVESNSTNISVSFDVYNGARDPFSTKGYDLNVNVCAAALKNGQYLYWSEGTGEWTTTSDEAWCNYHVEASNTPITSEYQLLQGLEYASVKLNLQNIKYPEGDKDKSDTLYILFKFPHPADRFVRQIVIFTNVEVTISSNSTFDIKKSTLTINDKTPDSCEWNIPICDGGYNANIQSLLPNVLLDSSGNTPFVSWMGPTDRGTLTGVTTRDIRRLRSDISHQLYGELRCPESVDLNSLFLDDKFTNALYYVNALELLAHRQVYKVQMRELLNTSRWVRPYKWTVVREFSDYQWIKASLNESLFLLSGNDPFRVEIYDTLTDNVRTLPYAGEQIVLRKGQNAVVVQIGDTSELYAVDHTGEVMSHLESAATEVLNFDTALYDADRKIWVSYEMTEPEKTQVTILSDEMELHSQNLFEFVAARLLMMTNGYMLVDESGNTYWHSYELHTPDTLLAVNDSADPMTADQWEAVAVSDAILVKMVSADYRAALCRRHGLKVQSTSLIVADEPANTNLSAAVCNNRIVVLGGTRSGVNARVWSCDILTGNSYDMDIPNLYGIGVCGFRAYFLGSETFRNVRQLYCMSVEETCYMKFQEE